MAEFNFSVTMPKWDVTDNDVYSLWDYFGLPVGVKPNGEALPNDLLKRAYNLIYNTYYRDENLQEEVDIKTSEKVLFCNVSKDYFTSAFKTRQRGPVTGLPVNTVVSLSGLLPFQITARDLSDGSILSSAVAEGEKQLKLNTALTFTADETYSGGAVQNRVYYRLDENGNPINLMAGTRYKEGVTTEGRVSSANGAYPIDSSNATNVKSNAFLRVDGVDLSGGTAIGRSTALDIADWRLAAAIQKWQERSLRGGVRYTEFLHSFFGVNPRDDRLQRPEYIGGSRSPVVTTEIIQSSSTVEESPLGTGAGHMISADGNFIGKYHAKEYGYVIGITRIVPKIKYTNGIRRHWLRNSPFDYYFPNFAHLSEQGIYNVEVFAKDDDEEQNMGIWGYQGIYNDMRFSPNHVSGGLRQSENGFLFWTMARKFDSLPNLNGNFISTEFMQNDFMRIFNIQDPEINRPCIVHVYNDVKFRRPMPFLAIPK